eukprot:gene16503-13022_t
MFGVDLVVGSLFLVVAHASSVHSHAGNNCSAAPLLSYHIHALFWQMNPNSTKAALTFQHDFLDTWGPMENCTFAAGDPQPNRTALCMYEVDWEPAGPFLTAQLSFFIPRAFYERTVAWSVHHRGDLDLMVHPNSGSKAIESFRTAILRVLYPVHHV